MEEKSTHLKWNPFSRVERSYHGPCKWNICWYLLSLDIHWVGESN